MGQFRARPIAIYFCTGRTPCAFVEAPGLYQPGAFAYLVRKDLADDVRFGQDAALVGEPVLERGVTTLPASVGVIGILAPF